MQNLLERLKLVDHLTIELFISKHDFVERLRTHVDQRSAGIFNAFNIFPPKKNEYRGTVTDHGFKIRRRQTLFENGISIATAEGNFSQMEDRLIIQSTIKGFHKPILIFILILPFFYAASLVSIFRYEYPGNTRWFFIAFILVHATFMIGIPYSMMRRGVSKMKCDLERDFHYFTKLK